MPTPDRGVLRKLADWDTGGLPVTSLYLDVDGRRHPHRGDYVSRVGDLVRKARDGLPPDREQVRSLEGDFQRVWRFVKDDFDRRGVRGLVLFSCAGAGLWEEVPLSQALRDRLVLRPRPYLLPLEAALERSEVFLVALVDRQRARIFRTSLEEAEEITHILDEVPGRHDQGGWAQARMQRHIEDHVQRHLKHVADVLLRRRQHGGFDHLVLGGPHEAVAELERELHDYVRRVLVDRAALPIAATPADVLAHVLALEERLERSREEAAVTRVASEARAASGRATAGVDRTLEALSDGRVETLVIAGDLEVSGVRCLSCGRLAGGGSRCGRCGSGTEAVPDVPEEAVEEALRRGCRVETVVSSDLSALGGIGALLRY